jgi:hypothetical protein
MILNLLLIPLTLAIKINQPLVGDHTPSHVENTFYDDLNVFMFTIKRIFVETGLESYI